MSMYYLNPKTGKYELQGAPHVDAYSKEQTDALIAENAGLQMELVWENASIKSAFPAQEISLDTKQYNKFCAVFLNDIGGQGSLVHFARKNSDTIAMIISGGSGTQSGTDFMANRVFTITDNKATFTDCKQANSGWNSYNTNMIPYKIYGIKGVKENV